MNWRIHEILPCQEFQLATIEEGFKADFLDAVELVQRLVFNQGCCQFRVHLGAIVLDFIVSSLQEAHQVCHLGGVSDGDIYVVRFRNDEKIDTTGTVGKIAVLGAVQGSVEAYVHRALIGVIQDIGRSQLIQLPVSQLDGDDFGVGFPDDGKVVDAVQDGADVVELLHDFHEEGDFVLEEGNACSMRSESGELVAQHIRETGTRDRDGLSCLDEQRADDGKVHYLVVVDVFIEDIQENLVSGMS